MLKILDQIYAFSPWRQRSDDTGAGQARPLQLQACLPGAHGVDDFAHRVEDELADDPHADQQLRVDRGPADRAGRTLIPKRKGHAHAWTRPVYSGGLLANEL
ncbi:hypothetical protein X772_33310 [Mesorhizobium sp. LSJC280B00]|nr:hypothetical protein X772_33310 [Mesorhizobium sp. LSJC280B00]